jgi:hypothetical protein
MANNKEAKLTAYVTTTFGEVYKSEPYLVKDIVKQGEYVR